MGRKYFSYFRILNSTNARFCIFLIFRITFKTFSFGMKIYTKKSAHRTNRTWPNSLLSNHDEQAKVFTLVDLWRVYFCTYYTWRKILHFTWRRYRFSRKVILVPHVYIQRKIERGSIFINISYAFFPQLPIYCIKSPFT